MGKTAKIILAIVGVFILACLVGSVVLARYGKQKFGEIVQEAQRQTAEARTWARAHSQGDCMNEGLSRVQACPSLQCQIAVQTFTSTCLTAASPTPGLCEGVPSPQDFMGTSQWINTRCSAFNGPNSVPGEPSMRCRNLLPVLQRHCFARPMIAAPDASVAATPDAAP